ncbi:hypothetical protein HH214_04365 [Mucilaginibacter robiniae]|uniref:DUF1565 domain-containing protein n=1 Tax=Mucilaginibacter robiniae TaxID=2728022 RepID=A0A7L5DYI0_9SPHI|nr:hypothetical protein [Mucilaginibacter robiniae]QJD95167.1 hypothetical protein HH214_04365 [Mucilaginibacter robiniae]
MANNFRYNAIVGQSIYISKAGNDSNSGLTPDLPKATVQAGLTLAANSYTTSACTIIIGTGTYEEAISASLRGINSSGYSKIVGDGEVVLRGNGSNSFVLTYTNYNFSIYSLRFENYSNLTINHAIYNCKIRYNNTISIPTQGSLNNCQVSDTTASNIYNSYGSIYINVATVGAVTNFQNCYTNASTQVNTVASPITFDYNNLMGPIKIGSGTAQTLSTHQTNYPNYNQHSINASPLFNNSAKYDFTLQAGSPHISAASDGSNIGGTAYAIPLVTNVADCWKKENGAVFSGLELSGTDVIISSGYTSGSVTSAPVRAFPNANVINKIDYIGFTLFNKSQAGGSATNKNVPDSFIVSDGSGGSNPDRLSIQMRWTDNDNQPTTDSDWINGYLTTTGNFVHFEINTQPLVDNSGYGNGNPAFNPAVAYAVSAQWVQFKVILTNAYA